jgi:hypothetical protein
LALTSHILKGREMNYVLLTILWVGPLIFIRNSLVYRYRMRAIEETKVKSKAAIDKNDPDWRRYYKEYDEAGSYNKMILDLTKWKYKHFYPKLRGEP